MTTGANLETAFEQIRTLCASIDYHPAPTLSTFANLVEQIQAIAEEATAEQKRAA